MKTAPFHDGTAPSSLNFGKLGAGVFCLQNRRETAGCRRALGLGEPLDRKPDIEGIRLAELEGRGKDLAGLAVNARQGPMTAANARPLHSLRDVAGRNGGALGGGRQIAACA